MMLFKHFPTFIVSALVMIFRSQEEIEIGLQFLSSCLFLPTLRISEIMLSVLLEYSHDLMISGKSNFP